MSRNDRGRRGSTSRGVRGRGRLGQIQPAERGAPPNRSLIPRSASRVVSDSIPRGVVSLSSSRARASILQSARQVGIHGGTFNTAGTQQFNITLNLRDQPDAERPPEPVAGSSRYQDDEPSREAREEESNHGYGHYDSTSWTPDPPVQRSCDIYYRHIAIKGRGSPLWIPGSNKNMGIDYQRRGTDIGDVGIITASGAFDFLFNICLPRDHPFNPPELPENFTPLAISLLDVQNYSEFEGESYLSSASVKKSRTGGLNDLTFESSDSEGAILTMPVGSRSEDIANTVRLRTYLATHAESWYNYIVGVRGREIQNGDVRLVIGWDKTKAWGMATFSNTSAHQEPFLLQFRPIEDASAGRTYGWVSSGFAEVRAGPGAEEKVRIRMDDPSQAGVEYQNQCLFIRTLNVNLQENAWKKLATEFGLAEAEAKPNTVFEASFLRPWREDNRAGDSSFSGMSSQSTSGSTTEGLTAPVETTAEEHVRGSDLKHSVQISSVQAALSGHPSNIINETLLKLRPNARMAITEDKDWMSVLHVGDTTLPSAEELFERITERFVIGEEDGVVSLQYKTASPSADLETVLMSRYPPVDPELKDKTNGPLAIREITRRTSQQEDFRLFSPAGDSFRDVYKSIHENTDYDKYNLHNIILVDSPSIAHLGATVENDKIVFEMKDERVTRHGFYHRFTPVDATDLDHVAWVLNRTAHFYWELNRGNSDGRSPSIRVEFYKLEETEADEEDVEYCPIQPDLCQNQIVNFTVDDEAAPYGLKLINNTTHDFYPYLFYFDNSDLSITPYYVTPEARHYRGDIPLKKTHGSLTLGYGSGGVSPFSYALRQDQDVDVGFLKLFVSTQPIDLTHVPQPSPFEADRAVQSLSPKPKDAWDTVLIPIIQRRNKLIGS